MFVLFFSSVSIQKIKKYWGGIITFSGKTMPKRDLRLGKRYPTAGKNLQVSGACRQGENSQGPMSRARNHLKGGQGRTDQGDGTLPALCGRKTQ